MACAFALPGGVPPYRSALRLALAIGLSFAAAPPAGAEPARPVSIRGKADPCTIVRIVDGDTADVRIGEKTERLRLLAIDTEESWPSAHKPVTPFGLETSKWAKAFLASEEPCFVEYGAERRDVYDRLLAYLWRRDGDDWKMYNLESVELGYSPYFTKYGYSEHHHEAFVAAEKRAQKAQKGIWDPGLAADLRGKYLGPGGLRAWWDDRAEALKGFQAIAQGRRDLLDLRTRGEEIRRRAGARLTVFTAIREWKQDGSQWVGSCESKLHEPFQVVAADGADPAVETTLKAAVGRYRYFRGVVAIAEDGKTLRLAVERPADIQIAPPPKPGTTASAK